MNEQNYLNLLSLYRRNRMKKILFQVILLCSIHSVAMAQEFDWLASNVDVANQHIVPKYQAVSAATDVLFQSVSSMCANDSAAVTENVVDSYRDLFLAWAQVQHIKFGPVSFLKRYERFHYWPDKHNVGSRQLQRLIASIEDGSTLVSDLDVSKKSVSLQGLSALERLFFSKNQNLTQTQCFLSVEIAKNLQQIAKDIDQSWRQAPVEFAKEFELAAREQGTYGSSLEVATMLANALATQLLIMAEYKLGQALPKKEGGRVYQRELEAWQSELSINIIEQSLVSLKELYLFAFADRTQALNSDLDKEIQQVFSQLILSSQNFDQPLIKTIVNADMLMSIVKLQSDVIELESLIRTELFTELNFATQFNSLDGD